MKNKTRKPTGTTPLKPGSKPLRENRDTETAGAAGTSNTYSREDSEFPVLDLLTIDYPLAPRIRLQAQIPDLNLRALAQRDPEFLKMCQRPEPIDVQTAAVLFEKPCIAVTPTERRIAKAANDCFCVDIHDVARFARKVAAITGDEVDYKAADRLLDTWQSAFIGMWSWQEDFFIVPNKKVLSAFPCPLRLRDGIRLSEMRAGHFRETYYRHLRCSIGRKMARAIHRLSTELGDFSYVVASSENSITVECHAQDRVPVEAMLTSIITDAFESLLWGENNVPVEITLCEFQ